jgi:hypothetical protein
MDSALNSSAIISLTRDEIDGLYINAPNKSSCFKKDVINGENLLFLHLESNAI